MRGRERGRADRSRAREGQTARNWELSRKQRRNRQERGNGHSRRSSGKRQEAWGYDKRVYNQATVFFFTNVPDEWSYGSMWETFRKHGRVLDIYSPPRKSKSGNRFRFVRFLDVKNVGVLERQLDQIRVGMTKLWVNRPRFSETKERSREDRKPVENAHIKPWRSYAEVVKGKYRMEEEPTKQTKQATVGGVDQQKQVKEEELTWLEGCYVGTTHSVELIPTLQEKFFMEGYFSCKVRPMGGRLVLLEGGDKEEMKDLVELAPEWLGQWFEDLKPWNPKLVARERFVWLRCQGVPTHAWGPDFFATIGNFISKSMNIRVNDKPFLIKVMEEEATNGIFSMTSDHVFRELMDADDSSLERWSLFSDMKGVGEESIQDGGCFRQSSKCADGKVEDDDKDRRANMESKNEKVADVESDLRSAEEAIKQSDNECIVADIGNTLGLLINSQEETAEEVGYVSDSLCEHLMQCQEHDSNRGKGEVSRPNNPSPSKKQRREMRLGLDLKACLGGGEKWATNLRPGATKKKEVSKVKGAGAEREKTEDKSVNEEEEQRGDGSFVGVEIHSEEQSFWQGFESETGQVKAWMGRTERKSKKQRRKRMRSCSYVYQKSKRGECPGRETEQSNSRKAREIEERMPNFSPDPQYQEAEESRGLQRELVLPKEITRMRSCEGLKLWRSGTGRGVGKEGKKRGVRELVARDKVDFLSVQESKVEVVDAQLCRALWGSNSFEWVAQPFKGMAGGLIYIWNPELLKKDRIIEGDNFIGIFGFWGVANTPVYIINIYSPCDLAGKRALWAALKILILENGGNWCLMGDFNAVRNEQEWRGGSIRRDMPEFDQFISECGLVDLPLIGRKFTWHQTNGAAMSRLDRFLLSEEWCLNWEDVKQWGLNCSYSDHCPIVLKNQIINWGPKPFRFFDAWLEIIDWGPKPFRFFDAWLEVLEFKKMVSEVWRSKMVCGWNGFRLKEKLKETKKVLKAWSRNMVLEIDKSIQRSIDFIASIDKRGEVMPLSTEDIELRRINFLELWNNQRIKESIWRQKARKTWLERLEEVKEIKEGVAKHFESLFQEEEWNRPVLDGIEFKKISTEEGSMLEAPFKEEEVKQAVWSCDSSKAPGPDGFNFKFIKEMWEVIKGDIMGFVDDFQKHGKLVRGVNSSFIVLIPKVDNPQKIEEFRPISLVGVMYKIIAKLLAHRLSSILNGVIGENQMAFIGGRQLADSVVIANETIDEAQKRKQARFVIKLDFEKAYDKVCWAFLDYMMLRLGFGQKWRGSMSECLKTAEVSVLLNGSATRQFRMQRGLRQGDPLSPFLFLIVAEGLNGIIKSAISHGLFEGITVGQSGLKVTHLQFADDTIVFGKASEENIWAAKCIMRIFEIVSRLKINFGKSLLMGINVSNDWMKKMSIIMNCKTKSISQMGHWNNGRWTWSLQWRRTIFSWEEESLSEMWGLLEANQPTCGSQDRWEWRHNKDNSRYSAKSGYQVLSSNLNERSNDIHERVWCKQVPSKICAFVWKVL
ncbi:hypothetical protein SLEP1_g27896 [Rubroshorea leprosula]|uniref:Reverse transcriptase domain-containing protein n=1 Tax=Rubroshorea leprosula TaxID=152421 RepID=A0AAV5K2N9_9ROSI|nr:hypothetical protein SLEP1_g27896 [Rubroshorea leprosula]